MHYNSVVIPNLGAFEWRYYPAELKAVEQEIHPPSYQLVFNSKHQEDTHQRLIHYIAEKKEIDLSVAQTLLVDLRLSMEDRLLKKEQLDLGKLGKLKMNKSGQIELLQDEIDPFLDPSRGLSVLKAAAILRDKSYLGQAAAQGSKKTAKRRGLFIFGGTAAFLLLATGISAIWWWPALMQKQESTTTSEISIIPAITEQQEQLLELLSAYENNLPEPIAGLEEDDFSENAEDNSNTSEERDSVVEPELITNNTEEELIVEPVPETVEETTVGANDYIIVIGVFGEPSNYERNARLLREAGYEVQLKKLYTGYTRVAAVVSCNSNQELQEKWAAIRQEFTPKAWIAQN